MRVLIYSKKLTSGLNKDAFILKQYMPKNYQCDIQDDNMNVGRYDIVIVLEHITESILHIPIKIFVPNPEMLTEWDIKYLPRINHIWCKTKFTKNYFDSLGYSHISKYMGFTSICTRAKLKKNYKLVGHFAGSSYMKGTLSVLKMWNQYFIDDERYKLIMSKSNNKSFKTDKEIWKYIHHLESMHNMKKTDRIGRIILTGQIIKIKNIYIAEHFNDGDYDRMRSKIGLFIQPSEFEGFGHVINEARCLGTTVLTTIDELVPKNQALQICKKIVNYKAFPWNKYLHRGSVQMVIVDISKMATKVKKMLESPDLLKEYGKINRRQFIAETKSFKKNMLDFNFEEKIKGGRDEFKTYEVQKNERSPPDNRLVYNQKYTFRLYLNDTIIQSYLKRGYLYEKYSTMIVNSYIQQDDTIIDVGANIGVTTIPYSRMVPRGIVYSFEPFYKNIINLKYNISINGCKNVKLYEIALGDRDTTVNISNMMRGKIGDEKKCKNIDSSEINYGAVQITSEKKNSHEVPMKKLDDIKIIGNIKLLKVDVEGSEPLVFAGAAKLIKKHLPIILFEKNWQELDNGTKKKFSPKFNIFKYCRKLGYNEIINQFENYILLHRNSPIIIPNPVLKYKTVRRLNNIRASDTKGYNLRIFIKPK